jgi:integrase
MASIEKVKSGYKVRCFTGRVDGKVKLVSRTFRTAREAQAYAREVETKVASNSYIARSKRTVAEYLTEWLGGTARARVKAQTHSSYEKLAKRYILPTLGSIALDKLSLAHVNGLYATLTTKGLSPRSVRYVHAVLRSALNEAVNEDLIARNPCTRATPPRSVKGQRAFLDLEQSALFLEAARDDEWYVYWLLLLSTGMRPSEALALMWSDIKGGVITVQRSLVGTRFDTTKTERVREVPIDASLVDALRTVRKAQLASGIDNKLGLAFTRSGAPLDLQLLRRRNFARIVKRAGLDPRLSPYSLRHSHISALVAAGVPIHTISERVGHASAKMTLDDYSHVSQADRERVRETLDKLTKAWGVSGG